MPKFILDGHTTVHSALIAYSKGYCWSIYERYKTQYVNSYCVLCMVKQTNEKETKNIV